MVTVNSCAQLDCACNNDGECTCIWGIEIDETGNCATYESDDGLDDE